MAIDIPDPLICLNRAVKLDELIGQIDNITSQWEEVAKLTGGSPHKVLQYRQADALAFHLRKLREVVKGNYAYVMPAESRDSAGPNE